jgi:hypothetical protein
MKSNFRGLWNNLRELLTKLADLFSRSIEVGGEQSKFVDLAPTDKADEAGVYSEALLYATDNPRVSNIALTGPYGSGKSSIIRSFLKKYRRPALHISLAAFLPEADSTGGKVRRQEIERSILQQMLYGADANKLPLSRFKRIRSPGMWSIFKSLYITLGLFAFWHLVQKREQIINGDYFLPFATSNWFNLACFVVGSSFLWLTLHHFYVASFGVSWKSISLKDIEIRPASDDQESILNRHLDEIIYFFQSTKYDLVVIEDLDRFNNSEIFVTLREINSLINANSGVKRTIRFLYALRDDMFVNTDRTKFFEFIIPVIPIINSSNSIDKVLEQGKRLSLDDGLDRQFLREVSRYLNDLRLIQNIFNEYAIYVANLETVLDANKLLAVLIYKNVYPKDFEDLHRDKGNLAEILGRHDEFVANGEATHKAEISRLEEQIDLAERQIPSGLQELRRIYAMALIEKLPASVLHIGLNGQSLIGLSSLTEHESFEQIIEAPRIIHRNIHNQQNHIDISGFQAEVDPHKTYQQRKDEIKRKSADFKNAALKRVRELRSKISTMRVAKFNEVIRLNAKGVEDLFEKFGENGELARFLVLEGYLDDTYYQYTSLFHSGRLSPNDNKFLIQIRGFINPEPDFLVDNPKEVIAAMRDEDFRQNYALNVKIVDCLLGNASAYTLQTAKLFELISSDFEVCEAFFKAYYATGTEVPNLISALVETWEGFIPAVIASTENVSHVAQIIAHLSERALGELPVKYPEISDFASYNIPNILSLGIDFEPARLKFLEVEIDDLAAIEDYPGTARFLFEQGLYQLTIANVEFIFRVMLGKTNSEALRTQHYTTVRNSENTALISRVERDIGFYLQNVLLRLEENSQERLPAILSIIERDEINLDDIKAFLEKQSAVVTSLDQVPTRLHSLLFQLAKVEASWENCLSFLASENFDAECLSAYLDLDKTLTTLSQLPIPGGDEASVLRKFLIEADALQDEVYLTYVRALPKPFRAFPENLGTDKLRIVIDEQKVSFSESNLVALGESIDLKVLFVAKNIQHYLSNQSTFTLDDEFREKLLGADIQDEHKLAIIQSMDITSLVSLPSRAAIVGPILDRTMADMSTLEAETARAVIVNSSPIPIQISLFNKCQAILGDGDVREILAMLPKPFSDIRTGYNIPRIEKTEKNLELVKWLESRNIISSWSEAFWSDEIRINLYRG